MDIQVETRGERRVVRIAGKITYEHSPGLQARLDQVLAEGARDIELDFGEVPFIDSSGIGEILRLYKLVRGRGGELVLANPNRKLRALFTMYRFGKFMTIREEGDARA